MSIPTKDTWPFERLPYGVNKPRRETVSVEVNGRTFTGTAVLTPNGLTTWQLEALWMDAPDPILVSHTGVAEFRKQVTEQLEAKLGRKLASWQTSVVAWKE